MPARVARTAMRSRRALQDGRIHIGRAPWPARAKRLPGATRLGALSLVESFQTLTQQSMRYAETNLTAISVLAIVSFPLYYFVWDELFPQKYENLPLRLLGSALWILILLRDLWPNKLKKYVPIFYYFTVLYSLPFFFTFMVFKNDSSPSWVMSNLAAIFLLVLLVDWLNVVIIFVFGSILGWLFYAVTTNDLAWRELYLENLVIYVFALVAGSVLNYRAALITKEKMQAMLALGGNIAHEMRTPLLGIKSGASGLKRHLPSLIAGYRLAKDDGLPVAPIRAANMAALEQVLDRIEAETDHANIIIDMLLMNAGRTALDSGSFSTHSIGESVARAISRYPFRSPAERSIIVFDKRDDFLMRGSELLLIHIIFNLIKNALFHVAKGNGREISITLETGEFHNYLRFRDDGTGISPRVLPKIFDRFYSSDEDGGGTGMGLSFCKLVMESIGGAITCQSELGVFTEFTLRFPKVA